MAKLRLYLHTYIIFFHLGISKSFIMLLFELIKPHNFTKHCSAVLQMNQGKKLDFSFLYGFSLCLKLANKDRAMLHIKVSFLNEIFILE